MCILMNDDDDHHNSATTSLDNSSKRDGRKRWQFHTHHSWIIPKRPLLLVLAMALFMLVMGMLFMAIGAGIASVGLRVVGGLLFGFGLIGLIICFVITVHAYFFYGTRDQSTQTTDAPWTDEMTLDAAGYSSVGRPSALKSPDSTLKRNGTLGVKKVTLAPELGDYGVLPLNNSVNNNNSNNMSNNNNHNTNNVIGGGNVGGVGSGGKANTINIVSNQQPLHRLPSTGSGNTSRANSMPRSGYVDGSTVGTGGIKITPLDPNSSQPSPASSISYGGSASQYYSTGGGGSTISGGSVNDTYAYPRSVQLSFDSGNSGSHYSTLRSIPVTHLGPGQKPSTSSYREVEYATVNKSGGLNKPVNTSVHVEHVPASQHQQQQQFQQHGGNSVSSQSQGLVTHVQMGQDKVGGASQRLVQGEDDRYKDYDNTPEPTPIIVTSVSPHPQIHQQQHQQQQHQQQAHGGNATYHEQQMQFQRHQRNHSQSQNQQQQDLHAPRQVNAYSHHRQYAPNPFTFQQQSQQQQQQEQQVQQYKMHYEQEKKQQQQQIQSQQSKSSAASSARNSMVDDVFEPQPLVYPSARRPMTFDKVTSSKMSVYDNVLANNLKESDEVEASG